MLVVWVAPSTTFWGLTECGPNIWCLCAKSDVSLAALILGQDSVDLPKQISTHCQAQHDKQQHSFFYINIFKNRTSLLLYNALVSLKRNISLVYLSLIYVNVCLLADKVFYLLDLNAIVFEAYICWLKSSW